VVQEPLPGAEAEDGIADGHSNLRWHDPHLPSGSANARRADAR
jgi:hypothetical protein